MEVENKMGAEMEYLIPTERQERPQLGEREEGGKGGVRFFFLFFNL